MLYLRGSKLTSQVTHLSREIKVYECKGLRHYSIRQPEEVSTTETDSSFHLAAGTKTFETPTMSTTVRGSSLKSILRPTHN